MTKQDGNADVEKPEEQIALTGMVDPIKPENDKSVIGDDNNVTEHELLISKLKEEVQVKFDIQKQKRLIIGNKFYEILISMNDNKAMINSFLCTESD